MRLLALLVLALGVASVAGADAPTADVLIPGKFYTPSDLSVLVGTTVTWRNADNATHTVTADDDSFDSSYIAPGSTFTHTFDRPGVYKLHCTIHRFMRGVVRVFALVLTGPPRPLLAGRPATLSGLVPADATEVALQRRVGGRWQEVARRRPLEGGNFTFTFPAAAPAIYRAFAGGTGSPAVSVHVAPAVKALVRAGGISASTTPSRPGSRAVLQIYQPEHFTFVTISRSLVSKSGNASFALPAALPAHLRVVVRGRGGWSDGVSQVVLVRAA